MIGIPSSGSINQNKYTFHANLDVWVPGGIWTVDSIAVADSVLNETIVRNGIDYNGQFFVIDSIPDIVPPEFISITVDTQPLRRGDSLFVTIAALYNIRTAPTAGCVFCRESRKQCGTAAF